jgi:small conductance mechanosensitive channel
MELPPWTQVLVANLTTFGLRLLGAIAVWIIGRRLIALAVRLSERALLRGSMDETLVG